MLERSQGLSTDLYELTMAAAYFENQLNPPAVFELFVRALPKRRAYLIAAGLEQALDYLQSFRLSSDEVEYVRGHQAFKNVSREFFDYLSNIRFTGDVWAMPEGTVVFGMEPILRIKAPVIEAQIIETCLLTIINFQTLIASKAARVVTSAQGRSVIEFGTRRAHGSEAGLYAARAAYIGGCIGTSNVEAGHLFGIPTFGTMAHSFIMMFDKEDDAFRAFLKVFPETATLLVDTYDTVAAVKRLTEDPDSCFQAVRLDSGDLLDLSIKVREVLAQAGREETRIFASSDLDEYRIRDLIARGAQIDSFGVGTQLATSYDAPALSGVYKLVARQDEDGLSMRVKLSADKATYPGPKQVWRFSTGRGEYSGDLVALEDEPPPAASNEIEASCHPLLEKVMVAGKIVSEEGSSDESSETGGYNHKARRRLTFDRLEQARKRAQEELKRLPAELLDLETETRYPVRFSGRLQEYLERARRESASRDKG
ncbi:MAG TPA: nicotinate phosphoribosyltransferase [Blastocatellia bacterium]|nr:nicotinate phosphoribosyltransferase [Blastocatellia bacterium]